MNERMVALANAYWASHLDCAVDELFATPGRIVLHGAELADYAGVFALFRGIGATISIPADRADPLRGLLAPLTRGCSPDRLAGALRPIASAVIGPAWIGYAERVPPPAHPARSLELEDAASLDALRQACDATAWEHGGSSIEHPCSGVFVEGRLAALAGYEIWGGTIAHISIITHPAFRARGFGRSAVAHLAAQAVAAGLLPQYRTLRSNLPSIRIAENLGFQYYAESIAVRLF